ncbi:MAG: ATP-binding protein [Planctomycetota bacterium]
MFRRNSHESVVDALADSPAVLIHGARQTGKTTLARAIAEAPTAGRARRDLSLDDAATLAAAREDPQGFITGLQGPVLIDEVQRAPGLFQAMKLVIDRNRVPGQFLLTGSANVLTLPELSESLAGRMDIVTLWPLSQGELLSRKERFIDRVFASAPLDFEPAGGSADLWGRMLTGGFPEVQERTRTERRDVWFGSYVTTILQRDVRDIANIEGLTGLPRLLKLLASRASGLLNLADVSRSVSVPHTTLKRYMALLEATFLLRLIPAWSTNLGKRLVKAPKVTLIDCGLMASLLGLDQERLQREGGLRGSLLESFVTMELTKQATWSHVRPDLYHYRTSAGQEVDLLLEDRGGDLVGIEIKANATVGHRDFNGLRSLAEATGARFKRGIVLYTGTESLGFGEPYSALPVASVWA